MKTIKVWRALQAVQSISNLESLSVKTIKQYPYDVRRIQGMTKQQVKLAIALSDTSYTVVNYAVEHCKDVFLNCKTYGQFVEAIETEFNNTSYQEPSELLQGLRL